MRKAILFSVLMFVSPLAMAKAPAKAMVCASCHGANGKATLGKYPNLAGQNKEYMISALKSYKDGSRTNAEMKPMAMMLNDAEVIELATYFSGLK